MHIVITTIRPNKKGVSYNKEPRLLECRYLSVRRGNSTCEASRERPDVWEHQSGLGLAEIGRLNESEHLGSVTFNRLKMLISLNQKGVRVGSLCNFDDDSSSYTRRTI